MAAPNVENRCMDHRFFHHACCRCPLPDSVDLLFLQHILLQQKFILFAINIITT